MTSTIQNCPVCKDTLQADALKVELNKYYPFCSKKCQNKDLGNWVFENYRVPSNERVVDDEFENEE